MARIQVIEPDKSYTFVDYFKLNCEPDDILAYFGYQHGIQSLQLPRFDRQLDRLDELKQRLTESLPYVSLTSEIARREFLIAPVLMDLIHYTKTRVKVAYTLNVSEQLKGELDYLLQLNNQLLVVEAKNADLERGLIQLAVELIAVEQSGLTEQSMLYGAVSIGSIWQFAVLDTSQKIFVQDLNLYRVPTDLSELFSIIIGILEGV